MTSVLLLLVFCAMQAIAQVLFKYGSLHEGKWLLFFILGNVFGASSIWFLMLLYRHMNVNVALALAGGGAFIACQLAVGLAYRSRLAPIQIIGVIGIAVCMALVTAFEKKPQDAPASGVTETISEEVSGI